MPHAPLAWPCFTHGDSLKLVARAGADRSRSLTRFFGASFCGLGLLLLLAGAQHAVPPALAGGGACLFSGLLLLLLPGLAQPPVLLLNRESRMAALCRRRFGQRRFRLFPFSALEIVAQGDGATARLSILPRAGVPASGPDVSGLDVPGLPSRISERQWRDGMALSCPGDDPELMRETLLAWMKGSGEIAGDDADARSAVVPRAVVLALESAAGGPARTVTAPEPVSAAPGSAPSAAHAEGWQRTAPRPQWRSADRTGGENNGWHEPRPPIRRAGDLRDSTQGRDKRD